MALTLADVRQRLTASGLKPSPAEIDENAWAPLPVHCPTRITDSPFSTVCVCSRCRPPKPPCA